MKIYLVGGAVRDILLGLEPKDRDYVVVGATPEDMLAKGFSKVGASFPVFLHPETGEEYALARTERKTGVGYNGFDVTFDTSITLEDDLRRRDLTINSMAMDLETNEIIDPFGGQSDLKRKILRHTSEAFAEDPVRVLRTARFAARYGFDVSETTLELMEQVAPELDHVPAERIFAEFQKGLMEKAPYRMLGVLVQCYADNVKSVEPFLRGDHDLWQRLHLVRDDTPLHVRFALIARRFHPEDYEACKIPTDLARVAKAVQSHFYQWKGLRTCSDERFVKMCDRYRAFSNPDFFQQVLDVFEFIEHPYAIKGVWREPINERLALATSIDAATIVASLPIKDGKLIQAKIHEARLAAMK